MIMAKDSNNNYVKIEDIKQQNSFNGISPIEFKGNGENLENYRIYGNTVTGESVGDRTGNLFDLNTWANTITAVRGNGIMSISGNTVSITSVDTQDCYTFPYAYSANAVYKILVKPNTNYRIQFSKSSNASVIIFENGTTSYMHASAGPITTHSDTTFLTLRMGVSASAPLGTTATISEFIISEGSEPLPYEPYGYKVPVTVEGKNLLQNTATSQTINDVAFTVNSDRSVTCNGTATQTAVYILNNTFSLEPGTYNLTGCPAGGGYADKYKLDVVVPPTAYGTDKGDGSSFTLSSTLTNAQYRIIIYAGQTCNNLTFYPMIRKADIEDDTYEPYRTPVTTNLYLPEQIRKVGDEAEYIDYGEQKMHRIGANDLDVTLPALPTLLGTNLLNVNTNIKPSKVWGRMSDPRDILYVKDNLGNILFSKYHEIEGEPPLIYKAKKAGTLTNYRIYGNTVDGESVGDRTGNLFDMKKFAETASQSYATINYSENSLIFIATRIDAYVNEVYFNTSQTIPFVLRPACINVQPRTTYTITMNSPYKCFISWLDDSFTPVRIYKTIPNNQSSFTFETPENCTKLLFRLGKEVENIGDTFVISNIMLNEGSTALPYEPYGYKVPVTVSNGTDTLTTPIYLPEQIRKVGSEVEYLDYGEQKMVKKTKTITFTSSTGWVLENDYNFYKTLPAGEALPTSLVLENSMNIPSTYTKLSEVQLSGVDANIWISRSGNLNLYLNTIDHTLEALGQLFESTPLIVTYELANTTDLDVTLPALPTLPGTNVLSVGTEVQPSKVYLKGKLKRTIYGWHVDPDILDSSNAVTYLKDAIGMIPASMGSSTFNYGSW